MGIRVVFEHQIDGISYYYSIWGMTLFLLKTTLQDYNTLIFNIMQRYQY